jgi:hypothetical protein
MARFSSAGAAIVAGGGAIVINTLALKAADLVPLATARGGLLRLVRMVVRLPSTGEFQMIFHLVVGLLMALFYAWLLEPRLRGAPAIKGLIYALGVWLANALVVLPLTGEGIAGAAHLTLTGMIWFAAAHTLFFVLLAVWYARLRR